MNRAVSAGKRTLGRGKEGGKEEGNVESERVTQSLKVS